MTTCWPALSACPQGMEAKQARPPILLRADWRSPEIDAEIADARRLHERAPRLVARANGQAGVIAGRIVRAIRLRSHIQYSTDTAQHIEGSQPRRRNSLGKGIALTYQKEPLTLTGGLG